MYWKLNQYLLLHRQNRSATIKKTANTLDGSKFTFYTGAELTDETIPGSTTHQSFTVVGAVYESANSGPIMTFDGNSWVGFDSSKKSNAVAVAKTKGVIEITGY